MGVPTLLFAFPSNKVARVEMFYLDVEGTHLSIVREALERFAQLYGDVAPLLRRLRSIENRRLVPARETLKRFLSRFTETTDVLGSFDLDPLEAQDRQLKFQGVRFEVRERNVW